MSALIAFCGLAARGQLTFIPATTWPPRCQKAMNSLSASEPRMTGGPATSVGKPEYSMLTSYWSV